MSATDDIQTLLSAEATPEKKLAIVERLTRQRLARLLGLNDPAKIPETFEDVVTNVTAARYMRIGQEGMASYSQDGLSMTFSDNDFAPYMDEINAFRNGDDLSRPRRGGFRFL